MDFKNILAKLDAVDNTANAKKIAQPSKKDAMQSILESFDRVAEAAKPDFLDIDKDGDKKEPMKKAAKEKDKDENVKESKYPWLDHPNRPGAKKEKEDKEEAKESVEEAIMVSAEGDEAEALLQILKLSGMPMPPAPAALPAPMAEPAADLDTMDIEMQDEYSNSPDEFEQDVNAVIANGTDLHREKGQYPAAARGDNPMNAFEGKFKAIMADLLKE
jgi:hypothetical protein